MNIANIINLNYIQKEVGFINLLLKPKTKARSHDLLSDVPNPHPSHPNVS
jgi:hypothetical protein